MTTESTLLAEDVDVMVDDIQFRERVRAFLDAHAPRRDDETAAEPPSLEGAVGHDAVAHARAYQTALYDAGLAGLTWPRRYGGQGLSPSYQTAFHEISTDYSTPDGLFIVGFGMCIPTILTHGTEAMKHRYVKPAARGEELWCQLFSEPSAGSDVAGLRSRAVLDGDEWILDGQKVWTSGAQFSQFGIVLARTDPDQPKHRGLSMFVLDMRAEGVTVRPLRQMNGGSGFNEVFFDNVRIPADQIIGAPGEGWRVALTTLMNERVAIGAGRSGEKSSPLAPISLHLDLSAARGLRGDPRVRQALIDLYVRHRVLDFVGLRIRAAIAQGREPGPGVRSPSSTGRSSAGARPTWPPVSPARARRRGPAMTTATPRPRWC